MNILIVDDDEAICRYCERLLSPLGHDVTSCVSSEEAASKLGAGWDLVLTDVMMPGVDGQDLLNQARSTSRADVILMTGAPRLESTIAALKAGASDFLIKPFKAATLVSAVERCAEKRRLSRELAQEKKLRLELDQACEKLARMERIKETFGQFATPQVVEHALEHPDFFKQSERRVVTVVFADVRRFTPFAESASPEEAVSRLNELLTCFIDAVQAEGGIINKFLGDGAMAVFGAPFEHKDHAAAAARAALRAREAVQGLARRTGAPGRGLRFGFGINSGEVVAGCLGTRARTEYSVIGHAVNVAARLQAFAGPSQILLGVDTRRRLDKSFSMGETLMLSVAGVHEPVAAAELLARRSHELISSGAR